mmetsp:Transcript_126142/g.362835  ORF Transcript_126142/g.362835 Transcript_126142/m.362835 type:complete len:281 (-) Transcript_126142:142-984(-)
MEVVRAFARDAALALATDACLQPSETAARLAEALSAEGLDMMKTDRPAASLRSALVAEFQKAAICLPPALVRLSGAAVGVWSEARPAPPVRVQVRGTAGRSVFGGAFTVGSGDGCDVQVRGDASVQATQLLVLSLSDARGRGLCVVADAWSGGSTQLVARGRRGQDLVPCLGASLAEILIVEEGQRVELQIGDATTVTLEPLPVRAVPKPAPVAGDVAGCRSFRTASTGLGLSRAGTVREHSPWGSSSSRAARSRSPRGGKPALAAERSPVSSLGSVFED